jgi:hypothetical protein
MVSTQVRLSCLFADFRSDDLHASILSVNTMSSLILVLEDADWQVRMGAVDAVVGVARHGKSSHWPK